MTDIKTQASHICELLELEPRETWDDAFISSKIQACEQIIQQEGGKDKSKRAKHATALQDLVIGYRDNEARIDSQKAKVYSMEELNYSTLEDAASYARRGPNSAVLQRIEYFCHHDLLKDGNDA
ncbi:MAG: hypothetical protein HC810_03380 [Acaryochloridaceae cyanobacterium RL_2_7]|nr:hypothetical protein [Acaryochloridaceae cyanobacterium RL_2_7]